MPVIEVKNLVKFYPEAVEPALKGVNLSITEGEFFGLLGPNAAGKTTLISIMCGLLKITDGDVNVAGHDVKLNPARIKKNIGLVPQEIALYTNLTIKENLYYFGQMHGLFGYELKRRVAEYMAVVELSPHAKKLVSKCSGGIKRRANLIAGLVHRPGIVFLDEPTLGVDAQSRNMIFEFLRDLNKKGVTLIYTTHYMSEAEDLCSKIIIIDNGNIIIEGSPAELIAHNPGCADLGQVFLKLTGKDLRE
jgi:ABC-2 type transport system ATP-binding protein